MDKALATEENGAKFLMVLGGRSGPRNPATGGYGGLSGAPIDYRTCVDYADLNPKEVDWEIEASPKRMRAHGVPGSWHVGPSMRRPELGAPHRTRLRVRGR